MLTAVQLQGIMPGTPAAKRDALLPFLQAAMREFAIESPARAAAFLAQLAHESGQFRFMEEIWGPTAAQRRYEPASTLAANLGNSEAGDGLRFKGRGPIQITGRANYRRFGDLLGTDLVAQPERAALPELAFRIAGLFWSKKGLNELADRVSPDAFREITRRINGGFNGLAERERLYETAKTVLNAVGPGGVSFGIEEELDTVEPIFERGLEGMRLEAAAAPTRRKTAKRKRPKRAAKRVAKKTTASRKRTVKPVVKKRAAKKAARKGQARKRARKGAAKRR